MEKFIWYNPTKLYFGKNQIENLSNEVKKYQKVLLVYGGGSIKKTGLYDKIIQIFNDTNTPYSELSGVEPNPKVTSVRKGIEMVKNENIDLILACGGGSTIDCAKAIAVGAVSEHDIMDILLDKVKVTHGLDIGTILTLSATGSEMNPRCVISDMESNLKLGIGTWDIDATFPTFSICDPTYTLSVPRNQTVNGIVDIIAHVLEQYFHNNENAVLGDEIAESILRTMIEIGPKLVNDLTNYELRETMMICGTLAWNGLLRGLTNNGDWACHRIEHALSAVYDIPHGEGLAIVTPSWMEYCVQKKPAKFIKLATNVFNLSKSLSDAELCKAGIDSYTKFVESIGAPTSMKNYGIKEYSIAALTEKTLLSNDTIGAYVKLNRNDVKEILSKLF